MKLTTKAALGTGGVLALALALGLGRDGRGATADEPSAERQLRGLEGQIADLRAELARTQQTVVAERQARLEQAEHEAAPTGETTPPAQPGTEAETPRAHSAPASAPAGAQMHDLLEARFSSEDDDVAWARVAREQAQALLASDLPAASRL